MLFNLRKFPVLTTSLFNLMACQSPSLGLNLCTLRKYVFFTLKKENVEKEMLQAFREMCLY